MSLVMTTSENTTATRIARGEPPDGRRVLRLPATRDHFAQIAASARREQQAYLGFLADLVLTACEARDQRRTEQRVRAAGFPWRKRLEDFSFDANPAVNTALVDGLAGGDWVSEGSSLCLIGGSGTGKSHLLIALGTCAAEAGYRVRYTQASGLVADLLDADGTDRLPEVITHYGEVDLLLIDDLGDLRLGHRGAELLLAVLTEREPRCAIASAANGPFPVTKTFTDPQLCAAIVDRLTAGGHTIDTGRSAYRFQRPDGGSARR
jgi:DNA replication protein DnaC